MKGYENLELIVLVAYQEDSSADYPIYSIRWIYVTVYIFIDSCCETNSNQQL